MSRRQRGHHLSKRGLQQARTHDTYIRHFDTFCAEQIARLQMRLGAGVRRVRMTESLDSELEDFAGLSPHMIRRECAITTRGHMDGYLAAVELVPLPVREREETR